MKAGANAQPLADWPEDLSGPVSELNPSGQIWVAFSGGLDSTLLLQVAAACHPGVRAIHVNHQLQPNHRETEAFCRELCGRLGVALVVERVNLALPDSGTRGLEAAARKARYRVFRGLLLTGDALLMAHHADDQAETVLFRLFRGSGVRGLAGMPRQRAIGAGQLHRPWLDISRERLQQVASSVGLAWQEDPSNIDQRFDRNYLRHGVMPGLKQRWPGLLQRLSATARACDDSALLNRRLAEIQYRETGDSRGRLSCQGLVALSDAERVNLVRWWIGQRGWPLPALEHWAQSIGELLAAREDGLPEIRGEGFGIRRYRGWLHLVPEVTVPAAPMNLEPGQPIQWGCWKLVLKATSAVNPAPPSIRITTRQGGERVHLSGGEHSKSLKNWFQEQGVPPWERPVVPLVFGHSEGGEVLIAIGDYWCSEQYCEGAHAAGWRLIVERDCD
ncbi:MAG: tRNA lysidine(34) synthetase TilS [Marinobacter sp. 34-60-7]|nr:MAG: tRNA lysidine(34) synthetase TilS [Marinobacter sp. 34-60-7]